MSVTSIPQETTINYSTKTQEKYIFYDRNYNYQKSKIMKTKKKGHILFSPSIIYRFSVFSDISERNNGYSDTLDFRRGWLGRWGLSRSSCWRSLIIIRNVNILIYIYKVMIQVAGLIRFSWNSHGWCGSTHGWTLLFLETIGPIETQIWGKMCPQNQFFGFKSNGMSFFEKKT